MNEPHGHLQALLDRYPALQSVQPEIERALQLLTECATSGGTVFVCGNGGSAADADHIVGELMKSFVKPRAISVELSERLRLADDVLGDELARSLQAGIPAIALTQHPALSSAFANDVSPLLTFAQQLSVLGSKGDVLWAISTSGDARNVLYAAVAARAMEIRVLGMSGASGGKLAGLCDVCICAPGNETYKIQEFHLPIYHALCLSLEELLW